MAFVVLAAIVVVIALLVCWPGIEDAWYSWRERKR